MTLPYRSIIMGVALSAFILPLSACDGQNARDILGLGRKAPDEFRVVSRPPLSTPPDFQLRPPSENEGDSIGLPPADYQARKLITEGKDVSDIDYDYRRKMGAGQHAVGVVDAYAVGSDADKSLLTRAGITKADPQIRERINQDVQAQKEAGKNWLIPQKGEEVIVDAEKEKARIEANKEAGKAITEGETPMIEPAERGVLEGLF